MIDLMERAKKILLFMLDMVMKEKVWMLQKKSKLCIKII